MKKYIFALLIGLSCLNASVYARQMPIETPASLSIPQSANLNLGQIRLAINNAANIGKWKWQLLETGPGVIEATLQAKNHQAVIEIQYTERAISYRYLSSQNLNYEIDGSQTLIHPNYNKWTFYLSREIERQLGLIK